MHPFSTPWKRQKTLNVTNIVATSNNNISNILQALNPLMHNVPKWSDTLLKILQQMLQSF